MPRQKVTLQYIPSEKTRRGTFKTRSQGLMKKAGDVAILCEAKACVIIYPEGKSVPQVFPSHDEAVAILNRFRSMEDEDPFNKKMDQEGFLMKRKGKIRQEALKYGRDYKEREIRLLLHKAMRVGRAGLSMEEITNVGYNVDLLLNSIRDRLTKIRGQPPVYMPSLAQALTPNVTGGMETIGTPMMYQAQDPTPYVTGGMDAIGAPKMYRAQALTPYVTSMDTIGSLPVYQSQAPTPYVTTGGMETIGAPTMYQDQEPLIPQEEWLMSGGGDLGRFNGGTATSDNQVMQPFDLGAWFGGPWGGVDPGPSSSAFPPM